MCQAVTVVPLEVAVGAGRDHILGKVPSGYYAHPRGSRGSDLKWTQW